MKSVIKEELIVPGQVESIGKLRDFIETKFKKHKVEDAAINAFKLSIDEAATNVIKYGYEGSQGNVTLRMLIRKESITVYLIDTGKYFDPMRVKDPNLQQYVQTRKKGGLGIFIIRKLMDTMEYTRTDEGNVLKLVKNRGAKKRKLNVPVPPMSITLKARYSLVSSAILTAAVLLGYIYFYFQHEAKNVNERLDLGISISESLSRSLYYDVQEYNDFVVAEKTKEKKAEFSVFISEIFLVDAKNDIYYTTKEYDLSGETMPDKYRIEKSAEQVRANVYLRTLPSGEHIYDISTPIANNEGNSIGNTHIWMRRSYIDRLVADDRAKDLTTALFILVIGYISIVVVIYMVMSPFQKLAEWVRALGHGDEINGGMNISDSGEIGEIARAFSDITTKFKDSQKQLVRQEQLQKEMQVAKEIQQTLLPTEFPKLESYEIGAFYEAAKEVGGDYFDFVEVDNDSLGIVVADVSGKGVPGSLVMTMIRTSLRTESRGMKYSDRVLAKVNDFVVGDMKKGMFVTVFYVIIDAKRRRLNYSSAGHNPMILYRGSTKKTYFLNPRGFPIGISLSESDLFSKSVESDAIQLKEDDILLLYTDGITEAMNSRREMFGEERLLKVIRDQGHLPVQPFVEKIRSEVHSFTEGFPQNDDITLVVIKEESSAEKVELKRAKNAHKLIQNGKSIRAACEQAGITTYAYYNKYKQKFEEEGIDNVDVEDESMALEAKHLSIEEKTKIYDIIREHPEYGAKRISEELNSEKYSFTEIKESRIYDELVRSRLNTKQLRESFISRSRNNKRIKPPGTPMLTLDGEVIIDKAPAFESPINEPPPVYQKPVFEEKPEKEMPKTYDALDDAESLLLNSLENVLNKTGVSEEENAQQETEDKKATPVRKEKQSHDFEADTEAVFAKESEPAEKHGDHDDFSFESLLPDGEAEFRESEFEETEFDSGEEKVDFIELDEMEDYEANISSHETEASSESIEEAVSFSAVDEILEAGDSWEDESFTSYEEDSEYDFDEEIIRSDVMESEMDRIHNSDEEDLGNSDLESEEGDFSDVLATIDNEMADIMDPAQKKKTILSQKEITKDEVNKDLDTIDNSEEPEENSSNKKISKVKHDDEILSESYEKLLIKGLTLYRNGMYDAAIEQIAPLVKKYPGLKEAHSILGNAYYRCRNFDMAVKEYLKVKELDPENLDAYENMGVIYANTGEYAKAINEWEHILEMNPGRMDIKNKIKRAKNLFQEKLVNQYD